MRVLSARLYCVLIAFCMTITSGVLLAQAPAQQQGAAASPNQWLTCETTPGAPGAFDRCNLRIEFDRLERGTDKEVLDVRRAIHIIPVWTYVTGDSAEHYAAVYRRASRLDQWLRFPGALMVGWSLVSSVMCVRAPCSDRPSASTRRTVGFTGAGLYLLGIPFRISAKRAAQRSLDFYNGMLGR